MPLGNFCALSTGYDRDTQSGALPMLSLLLLALALLEDALTQA